ncbi:hypothetical protein PTSG_10564 [Salpingoeca rosetta]|uniref:Uncharacterized protein n=1 Tax=Salpingoeca rosetta (strain ATCC 50818 / BSB-021) TaxID=946362 RepID=F2URQ4_SALR5|nr:uncharacterized protein PTSG_10564 [Salpingoeca rosetta]EGD80309.1 hypothetical protein PTSG_10564 [Salpingoeca rosetta]|eukprot:XP_004988099.1 hypothetical protein PTSG_10564 [Salpingoeca rosetta]
MATPAETVDLKPDEEGAEDEASTLNELLKLIDEYDDRDALHSFFERLEQEEHDRVRGVAVPTLHAEFSKLICDPEASDKRISVILSIAARIHVEAEARRPERKQD